MEALLPKQVRGFLDDRISVVLNVINHGSDNFEHLFNFSLNYLNRPIILIKHERTFKYKFV